MVRAGIGFDSHRLVEGRPLILAGHSDADAVAHAVTDAILGAAAAGDIGSHFPDTDPRWKGADSLALLRLARELVEQRGYRVQQVDITIILEHPRLGTYKQAMAQALADALGLGHEDVGIKAKSNEGMGFVGRGEGVAVMAVATVEGA